MPVLLLNQSYEVLGTMPLHQAMKKLMRSPSRLKVEAWEENRVMRTSSGEYPVPSVVRLDYYLKLNWHKILKKRDSGSVSRLTIFRRDDFQCQFCGKNNLPVKELTLDHINPKSRGGKSIAQNLVTACKTCNGRKRNRTPEEARMPLITPLKPLKAGNNSVMLTRYAEDKPEWRIWLKYEEKHTEINKQAVG